MKTPLISVLMPVFNGELYLKEAVGSILQQTYSNWELIVINDGSTDRTSDILASYQDLRVKVFENNRNLGIVDSLNVGLKKCSGVYIARMDADDIASSDRFKKQLDFLERNKEVHFVGSYIGLIDESGNNIGLISYPLDHFLIKFMSLFANPIAHPAVMVRAEVFRDCLYRPSHLHAEDYDLWMRLLHDGKKLAANIGQPLVSHRVHGQAISSAHASLQQASVLAISSGALSRYISLDRPAIKNRIKKGLSRLLWYNRLGLNYTRVEKLSWTHSLQILWLSNRMFFSRLILKIWQKFKFIFTHQS